MDVSLLFHICRDCSWAGVQAVLQLVQELNLQVLLSSILVYFVRYVILKINIYYLSCHVQLVIFFCVTLSSSFKCPSDACAVCGCLYSFTELYLLSHSLSLSCSLSSSSSPSPNPSLELIILQSKATFNQQFSSPLPQMELICLTNADTCIDVIK